MSTSPHNGTASLQTSSAYVAHENASSGIGGGPGISDDGASHKMSIRRTLSTSSRRALTSEMHIDRKVSNVLDHKDAAKKRREQLSRALANAAARAPLTRCQAAQERLFTTWQYRATELWARGTSSQIKVLVVGFGVFLIFCTVIMHVAKLFDEYLGYVMDEPWCGNSTAWYVCACWDESTLRFCVHQTCALSLRSPTHLFPAD